MVYDDAQITDCEKVEIIAVQVDEQRSPILVVQFMTQQVNCVRNREGDVVEGYPSDIRAYFCTSWRFNGSTTTRATGLEGGRLPAGRRGAVALPLGGVFFG